MTDRWRLSGLTGYAPALPTPFDENGEIDVAALERFCDRQITAGANALVYAGPPAGIKSDPAGARPDHSYRHQRRARKNASHCGCRLH